MRDHSFVGNITPEQGVFQHQTYLYYADSGRLSYEMFYQLLIRDFGNFGVIKLSEPADIFQLAMIGLDLEESGWNPADGSKENLSEYIVTFLSTKAEMLKDYFSFEIKGGKIHSIPLILKDYVPAFTGLPLFLLRMSTEVEWETEKECFETLSKEFARFYALRNGHTDTDDAEGKWSSTVEHVIYQAFRKHLQPPESVASDGTFLQLANLHEMYKVFERC